jgi:uncharacterized membrane protein
VRESNVNYLEALSFVAVVACFACSAAGFAMLPATISTHFDITGAADAHGPKGIVWFGSLFSGVLYVFLSVLQKLPPQYSNYPVAVTERNRERLYSLQREMLSALKLSVVLTGLALEWGIVASARRASLDPLFLPAIAAAIAADVAISIYYIGKMLKA